MNKIIEFILIVLVWAILVLFLTAFWKGNYNIISWDNHSRKLVIMIFIGGILMVLMKLDDDE